MKYLVNTLATFPVMHFVGSITKRILSEVEHKGPEIINWPSEIKYLDNMKLWNITRGQ